MLFDIFPYMQDASSVNDARLRVGQLLGSGRHGVVLQATLLGDDRAGHTNGHTNGHTSKAVTADTVAVKMPSNNKSLDSEAEALRRFSPHPHIVELIDGPNDDGALVLEFCALGTLADHVEAKPLSVEQAGTVLQEIGSALEAIHAQGWIHGDVSLGNIGVRADGTTVLLDFATAREASDDYITEGTAEYSGPIRTAQARLDVRCLAASMKAALPDPTANAPLPPTVTSELARLDEIIERCDMAEDVAVKELTGPPRATTADLTELVDAPAASDTPAPPAPRLAGGGPDRPQTREFGPRPGGGDSSEDVTPDGTNRTRVALAAIAAVGLFMVFFAARYETTSPATPTLAQQLLVEVIPSSTSLVELDVEWRNGVATRHWPNGDTSTFVVGQPGDIAAVGDWNCTGDPMLGVYRPETGAWFTFSSWEAGATSGVEKLDVGRQVLSIERNTVGCDRPVIS